MKERTDQTEAGDMLLRYICHHINTDVDMSHIYDIDIYMHAYTQYRRHDMY